MADDSTADDDSDDLNLDDLLGSLDDDTSEDAEEAGDDLDALLGGLDSVDDGESDAGADSATDSGAETVKPSPSDDPEFAYGTMSSDRPEPQKLQRKRFRLAILGDFSGRAAKGVSRLAMIWRRDARSFWIRIPSKM
ncbi:hypothetical protein EBB79_24195 (plasmid) [Parasedimentitalea marina]|uniref:Uncharacterized protein n=1 Tax=Parasedimentitalea marina TaxID=2483033 RepID=A0A3T0NAI0_9RHOB|nr:hypothetical protein [Parasedimentitalea marina]AZV81003.1 hypothetical protein EBB79_24195 [Parasedimentitalea marina]